MLQSSLQHLSHGVRCTAPVYIFELWSLTIVDVVFVLYMLLLSCSIKYTHFNILLAVVFFNNILFQPAVQFDLFFFIQYHFFLIFI